MATAETAAKARLGKFRKKADELGIPYSDDTTEEILREAISQHTEPDEPVEVKKAEPKIDTANADFAKLIAVSVAEAVTAANKKHDAEQPSEDGTVDERFLDPDDKLEMPIVYFTPQFFWILPIKKVGGQKVRAPFGRIIFKKEQGGKIQNGTQWNTQYISAYRCQSKREQAYIETHEMYNRRFFKSMKDATALTSANVRRAERYSLHIASLSTRQSPELYPTAAMLGIDLSTGMAPAELRRRIADKLTDKDMEDEKLNLNRYLQSQGKEHLLAQGT